jgi:serine/threonine protein phosphatase PrpC
VPDQQIRERLLNMNSAPEVCAQLVQDALDGGGTDNITVIVGRAVKRDNASR